MDERVAVVTGGGQGIGLAICQQLAASGNRVIVVDIDGDLAQDAAKLLPGDLGVSHRCDVMSYEQVKNMADWVIADFGVPEAVVMNVGWTPDKRYLETSLAEQQKIIAVNLEGSLHTTRVFLPGMIEAMDGRLVFISSDAARAGVPGQAVYAAAKAGLIGFAKSMAVELARYEITVNVVCPGTTNTPLTMKLSEDAREKRIKIHPRRRFAEPHDIAVAVDFFVRPESSFITGQVLSVNGGMLRAG